MYPLLRLLLPPYRRHLSLFLWGVFFVFAVNALALYAPWATGRLIDELAALSAQGLKERWADLLMLIGSVLLAALLRGALMVGMRQTLVVLSRRVEREQREALVSRILSWDLRTLGRYPVGELMTYFTEDLNRIRNFTGPVLLYGLNAFVLFLFTAVLMTVSSLRLAFVTLLPLLLLPVITYYLRRRALQLGHEQQLQFARLSGFVQQIFPYLRALKALGRPTYLSREMQRLSEAHRTASMAVAQVEASLQPLTYFFVGISMTLVLLYGGYEVMRGRETLGTISAFSLYLLQLLFPLGALGWLYSLVQQARASAERLLGGLAVEPAMSYPVVSVLPTRPSWRWERLGFRYGPEKAWVFRGLQGEIPVGSHIAIAAPIGSGKTTLARLLVRQMDPTEGCIWLGEAPLAAYSLEAIRRYVGYVPQEPVLFEGSVAANLRLAAPTASRQELWQALEWVGLAEEVTHLPRGLLTPIGEWGQQVSGGQRQRLALAMMLLRKPAILLLDDPFAPLDGQKITEILFHLQREWTACTWLIMTHRQEVRPHVDAWWDGFVRSPTLQKEG